MTFYPSLIYIWNNCPFKVKQTGQQLILSELLTVSVILVKVTYLASLIEKFLKWCLLRKKLFLWRATEKTDLPRISGSITHISAFQLSLQVFINTIKNWSFLCVQVFSAPPMLTMFFNFNKNVAKRIYFY